MQEGNKIPTGGEGGGYVRDAGRFLGAATLQRVTAKGTGQAVLGGKVKEARLTARKS